MFALLRLRINWYQSVEKINWGIFFLHANCTTTIEHIHFCWQDNSALPTKMFVMQAVGECHTSGKKNHDPRLMDFCDFCDRCNHYPRNTIAWHQDDVHIEGWEVKYLTSPIIAYQYNGQNHKHDSGNDLEQILSVFFRKTLGEHLCLRTQGYVQNPRDLVL